MSDDEWEYEYSTTETESLYFTLDLTTHVPDALTDQPLYTSGSASKNNSAPRTDPSARHSSEDASSGGEEQEDNDAEGHGENLPTLQILDLHTSNPLIKFDQSVYSAYWTTDLGTQFHIAQTGLVPDPLRKGTILDVLGVTRARLLGRPVQLIDRNAPPSQKPLNSRGGNKQTQPPPAAPAPAIDLDKDTAYSDSESLNLTTGPLKIPRAILKTAKSQSQASFLERLSEIKLRKGEKDQVPIIAVKHYTKPANSEDIKRKAEDDDRNSALVNNIDGKKRRRRRPMGVKPRNAGGAGRPSRGDIEGMLGFSSTSLMEEGATATAAAGENGDGVGEEDGREGRLGPGMFGPGGRGEIREEVAGYLEDPFQSHASSTAGGGEEGIGTQTRHPGTPGTNFSSPAMGRRASAKSSASHEDSNGYLLYQTRAEYLSTLRAEAVPKATSQPPRPPEMGGGRGGEEIVEEGRTEERAEQGGAGDV